MQVSSKLTYFQEICLVIGSLSVQGMFYHSLSSLSSFPTPAFSFLHIFLSLPVSLMNKVHAHQICKVRSGHDSFNTRREAWRPCSSASSHGSRRPGIAASFRPQSAASRFSSSSMQEAESPGKQSSPQTHSARMEALAAVVSAKEREAAELRKRMHEMSQDFNAHLAASGSLPMQFSAGVVSAGVVHQVG